MTTLFGGTQARGEDAWTPSSGSIPEDLNMQMASLLLDISNTQNAVEQEPYVDVEMEELMLMSNVRRKRPGPSRSKKNAKISKFDDSLERIVIILEGEKNEEERKEKERKEEEMKEKERKDEERKEEERKEKERKEEEMKEKDKERKVEEMKQGPTMQECIATLKLIPNIKETSELYFFGTRAFKDKDNRNIFMSFESDDAHIYWLKVILKHWP